MSNFNQRLNRMEDLMFKLFNKIEELEKKTVISTENIEQ